jgi:hypothetical protein
MKIIMSTIMCNNDMKIIMVICEKYYNKII